MTNRHVACNTGPPSIERLNEISTTEERLEALLTEIINRRLSADCYTLMCYLAFMTPYQRLRYNIKNTMWLLGYRLKVCQEENSNPQALNMLTDGLTYDERQVLMEIDASGAPVEVRRTAHSLMDLDVRQRLAVQLGGTFKDRWERIRHRLVQRPLDNTVRLERN